jgi:hypothetical protein
MSGNLGVGQACFDKFERHDNQPKQGDARVGTLRLTV